MPLTPILTSAVKNVSMDTMKYYAKPSGEHVSLGRLLRFLLFIIPVILVGIYLFLLNRPVIPYEIIKSIFTEILFAIIWGLVVSGIRIAAQWERGVVLRLGKFHTVKGPGIMYIIPVIDYVLFIDMRILVINIPKQKVITMDNVPAEIDAALFFMVKDSEKAVVQIQDFKFAIAQYAQAALRDVVGGLSLDELLSARDRIQKKIGEIVEERIKDWGLHVDSIRLQDIELPEDLKKMMSRQASAEREKRATITKAEGDKMAAANLAQAAEIMQKSTGAMQLRTLQTIDGLGPTASNTVVIFPAELMQAVKLLGQLFEKKETPST